MWRSLKRCPVIGCVTSLLLLVGGAATPAPSTHLQRPLVIQAIDETDLVTLAGNMRKEMTPPHDRGAVPDDLVLRMYLQLNRAPEVQQAMDDLVNELHDPKSAQYRKWLTADEIAEQFGPHEADVHTATHWLESHGFTVNVLYRANGVIDFSGPASAIRQAFHTEIHNLSVNGKSHMANANDPKIPAALAGVVHGLVSLHNFRPHAMNRPRPQDTFPYPAPFGGNAYALAPDDLYTIYDFDPLYDAGITGKGQTIVVLEDSDVYSVADWQTFRTTFGLATRFPYGSLTQIHPQPPYGPNSSTNCADPGVNADDFETELDAEWASAAAPNASIIMASCADSDLSFNAGVLVALQNILTGESPVPAVISTSYGDSETDDGPSYNAYVRGLYEIAVLQGVSLFVAAGDSGADSDNEDYLNFTGVAAFHGINVNGWASTPFNVAVGGTDFSDAVLTPSGVTANYWSNTNGPYFGSALSYVPEMTWNNSCASSVTVRYFGFGQAYGTNGFCNSSVAVTPANPNLIPIAGDQLVTIIAGSGGPSGCAYGAPSIPGVVSGTCRGYDKPLFQRFARGNPRDGVRDVPDVSMFAANGTWSHYYILCFSDPNNNNLGAPCTGTPSYAWSGGGGTSFGTPIMAGIQALINQATGERQGNPDFVYYVLAAAEDYFINRDECNATLGNQINPHCIFHDVTLGNNDVPCLPLTDSSGITIGTFNCYIPSGTTGVMSLSNTSYEPAYPAKPGWDFATGLGSVDAYNLVTAWPGSRLNSKAR